MQLGLQSPTFTFPGGFVCCTMCDCAVPSLHQFVRSQHALLLCASGMPTRSLNKWQHHNKDARNLNQRSSDLHN